MTHPPTSLACPLVLVAALLAAPGAVASPPPGDPAPPAPSPALAVAASVAAPVVLVGGGLATLSLSDETDFDAWEAAGVTMLATGVLVGPSAGHAYTGHWGKAAAFSLGRAVCVGVFTVGATGLTETALLAGLGEEGETESDPFDVVLTLGGLAGWVGLSAWEAVETWDSAQEAGRRSERPSVQVSARVFRSPPVPEAGGHGWGLAVSGSY